MSRNLVWFPLLSLLLALPGCSGSDDDDTGSSAGAPRGGSSSSGAGGTPSAGSGVGGSGSQASDVDCAAVCGRVGTLCMGRTDIGDVWLDVCESACDARVQVAPDTALLEQTCVNAATDCNTAVICVATPN